MPAIGLAGSSCAAGLTMSLAPMTIATSVSGKSSLISSISKTMSYGHLGLGEQHVHVARAGGPATGWIAKRTSTPAPRSSRVISFTACCACATAMP